MKLHSISTNKMRLIISMWPIYLFAVLFLVASLFTTLILMMEYTLVCKNKQYHLAKECVLQSNVYNLYHSSTGLGDLKAAVVKSSRSSKGNTLYYIDLLTDKGSVNLTGSSSSGRSDKDIVANRINNYISNSLETTFKVSYPASWWMYGLSGFFLVVGVFLLTVRGAIIDFDRILKTIAIKRKGLFKTEETKLSFSDVDKIIVEESLGSRGTKTYRLAIALKDKAPLPLVTTYDSSFSKKEMIAKQLNQFIDEI
ncbi:TPA: hypothetical protein F8R96_03995 [Legionella pneumophila]|nr:hypothetical protein [Legionella pneumophila]HAU1320101.1 hypothetical protein [Legionella pneumophila]HBC0468642.1 hypothetical protein [Legionella pneumophila]HBI2945727.1 hypothetical protein [Legionella pneumophila]HDV6632798.1 hypothetical protein [Legionella pneumophila]